MPLFQTIIHPTDFDDASKEAFRVARSLAQTLGARVIVFHVVPPPAAVTQDGRVLFSPKDGAPVDLWVEYRRLQADAPQVAIDYTVVVGDKLGAKHLLEEKVRELGEGVVVVMGSHGRTGLSRLLWGSTAEEVVRDLACPVLVVNAPRIQANAQPANKRFAGKKPASTANPAAQAAAGRGGPIARRSGAKSAEGVNHE